MSFRKTLHREIEVAFSKHAQPVVFRVIKYAVLIVIVYFFWGRYSFISGIGIKQRDGQRVMAGGSTNKINLTLTKIFEK